MIDDQDWKILNDRLESIERSIDMLKALFPEKEIPQPYKSYPTIDHYKALQKFPCVFDNMPEPEKMKPLCISCMCPKCSPYALSFGSLQDSGSEQIWRNKDEV